MTAKRDPWGDGMRRLRRFWASPERRLPEAPRRRVSTGSTICTCIPAWSGEDIACPKWFGGVHESRPETNEEQR